MLLGVFIFFLYWYGGYSFGYCDWYWVSDFYGKVFDVVGKIDWLWCVMYRFLIMKVGFVGDDYLIIVFCMYFKWFNIVIEELLIFVLVFVVGRLKDYKCVCVLGC